MLTRWKKPARLVDLALVASVSLGGCSQWGDPSETSIEDPRATTAEEPQEISRDLGNLRETANGPGNFVDAAFFFEEDFIVALTFEPAIHHLDPVTLQEIRKVPIPEGLFPFTESGVGGDLRGKYLSPDGTKAVLAQTLDDGFTVGPCAVIDTRDGSIVAEFPTEWSCNFSFTEDGTLLYHAEFPATNIKVYETENFERVATFEARNAPVHVLTFDDYLAYSSGGSFSEDGFAAAEIDIVRLSGEGEAQILGIGGAPKGFVSPGDAPWILISTFGGADVLGISRTSQQVVGVIEIQGIAEGAELAGAFDDGLFLVGSSLGGTISSISPEVFGIDGEFNTGMDSVFDIVFSPDGQAVYLFGNVSKKFEFR